MSNDPEHAVATKADYGLSYADPAPALVFGDDARRRDRIADVLARRGVRVVASGAIAGAGRRVAAQSRAGLIVVDVVADGGPPLDALLREVLAMATCGVSPALLMATSEMIDTVAPHAIGEDITLLIDPDEDEIGRAIDMLAVARPIMLGDSAAEGRNNTTRLAQLSEEVGRIARALAALSANDTAADLPVPPRDRDAAADLALIRSIIRMRRLREQFLDPALFADPAWDMLLDLAAAELERRTVAVSSLCIAASVPATTALRWIATMTEHELLVRRPDPEDGRRVFVALSERASAAMSAYLAAAAQVMAPIR